MPQDHGLIPALETLSKHYVRIIIIIIIRTVHEANRREREVGSYPENSIVGDSKDTKKSTVPVRRRKRETWDPW